MPAALPPRRLPALLSSVLPWVGVAAQPVVVLYAPVAEAGGGGLGFGGWWIPLRYLLPALVVALPAGLLPRRPLVALGLMLAGATVVTATVNSGEDSYLSDIWYLQFLVVDVTVGVVAASRSRRLALPATALVLVAQVVVAFVNPGGDPVNRAVLSVLAVVTSATVGSSVRARRRYAATLRSHAAAEAVTAERLRIARELHDMVAHSIGVIAIQAGVGARVIDTQPAQARAALRTIEATSRDTLAGLRRTLGALRRPESASSLDPTPGLDDLDRLVAAGADAGVRVELRRVGRAEPVPDDIGLAVFRIVQEAVTNVVRHAGTDTCRVVVEQRPDEVGVEVVDGGRGGPVGGEGHGIVGMRERVALLGGRFTAAPRPDGGFRVAVRLPLPAAVTR
ncbi:sensor histidine kinase [Micromonospora sp. NPDC050187]|uniref:sensor histidine kinase n=1 Tax=Micromonospora sp. NPDC050187 TaxID=3364277 RepID=UPI00379DD461